MNEEIKEFGKKLKSAGLAEEVKAIAAKIGIEPQTALESVYKIYMDPCISSLNEESRMVTAVRIFKAQSVKKLLSQTLPYEVYVIDKTGISSFVDKTTGKERQVSRVFGVAKPAIPDAATKFAVANITLFDDKAQISKNIRRNESYKMNLTGGLKNGILNLYSDETTTVSDIKIPKPDVEEVIKSVYPQKTIMELESLPDGALVYVRASVINTRIGASKNRNWGMYVCIDDSVNINEIDKHTLSVFLDAEQVRYASGSEIGIVGSIQKTNDTTSFRGLFVNPILVFEMQTEQQKPQQATTQGSDSGGIEDLLSDDGIW